MMATKSQIIKMVPWPQNFCCPLPDVVVTEDVKRLKDSTFVDFFNGTCTFMSSYLKEEWYLSGNEISFRNSYSIEVVIDPFSV